MTVANTAAAFRNEGVLRNLLPERQEGLSSCKPALLGKLQTCMPFPPCVNKITTGAP